MSSSVPYNHFDLFEWVIYLPEFSENEINNNFYAQSVLIHEYIHYCQQLSSTFGRLFFENIITSLIKIGLFSKYGENVPTEIERVNMADTFLNINHIELKNSKLTADYDELVQEYNIICSNQLITANKNSPVFTEITITYGTKSYPYPHLLAYHNQTAFFVPLTETVIYENMARQVQRNFFRTNNHVRNTSGLLVPDSELLDKRKNSKRELLYVCINEYLSSILPDTEDISKWTITLCQLSLLCRFPGNALRHILDRLSESQVINLDEFMLMLERDNFFANNYNQPNLQKTADDLVLKYSKYFELKDRINIYEFVKRVIAIANAVQNNKSYFYNPQMRWNDLLIYLNAFGCPPIFCKDKEITSILGYKIENPFRDYFVKLNQLLS